MVKELTIDVKTIHSLQKESQNPMTRWSVINRTGIMVRSIKLVFAIMKQLEGFIIDFGNAILDREEEDETKFHSESC